MNIYKTALDIQDASNLSGIVRQFARDMAVICQEVREQGGSTEDMNRHPVCRLYAEQIAFLSGAGTTSDTESFRQAYEICQERAEPPAAR